MAPPSILRAAVGALIWAGVLYGGSRAIVSPDGIAHEPAARLARFATESARRIRIAFPPEAVLARGDPVLVRDPERYLLKVGRVFDITREENALVAEILVWPEHAGLLREGLTASAFRVPVGASWVVETLFPPERLAEMRAMGGEFLRTEGDNLERILWPEIKEAIREVVALYEQELPVAIREHSEDWGRIYERHRQGVIEERLLPALKEVTLPIAVDRFSPLLEVVGEKLWKELPVWSLGWRYVVAKMDITDEVKLRARFRKYIEEKAVPILAAHTPEAGEVAVRVIRESLEDPRVKEALSAVFGAISSDPEFLDLLRSLADRLIVRNEDLRRILAERWKAGLRSAVAEAARRSESLVHRIVDSVVLDEARRGINPRLAQVLRSAVFRKDGRWVVLEGGEGAAIPDGARVAGAIYRD